MKKFVLSIILFIGLAQAQTVVDGMVAVIDNVIITRSEVYRFAEYMAMTNEDRKKLMSQAKSMAHFNELRDKFYQKDIDKYLRLLLVTELILKEGEHEGYRVEIDFDNIKEARKKIYIANLKDYLDKNEPGFNKPELPTKLVHKAIPLFEDYIRKHFLPFNKFEGHMTPLRHWEIYYIDKMRAQLKVRRAEKILSAMIEKKLRPNKFGGSYFPPPREMESTFTDWRIKLEDFNKENHAPGRKIGQKLKAIANFMKVNPWAQRVYVPAKAQLEKVYFRLRCLFILKRIDPLAYESRKELLYPIVEEILSKKTLKGAIILLKESMSLANQDEDKSAEQVRKELDKKMVTALQVHQASGYKNKRALTEYKVIELAYVLLGIEGQNISPIIRKCHEIILSLFEQQKELLLKKDGLEKVYKPFHEVLQESLFKNYLVNAESFLKDVPEKQKPFYSKYLQLILWVTVEKALSERIKIQNHMAELFLTLHGEKKGENYYLKGKFIDKVTDYRTFSPIEVGLPQPYELSSFDPNQKLVQFAFNDDLLGVQKNKLGVFPAGDKFQGTNLIYVKQYTAESYVDWKHIQDYMMDIMQGLEKIKYERMILHKMIDEHIINIKTEDGSFIPKKDLYSILSAK